MVFSELLQRFLVTESTPEQADIAINKTIRILGNQVIVAPDEKINTTASILINNDSRIQ
jgi:hypothetical protein